MSYADRIFKELRNNLHNVTKDANKDDLETTKDILLEYIELIDGKIGEGKYCPDCNGEGEFETTVEYNGREIDRTFICHTCKGTGRAA